MRTYVVQRGDTPASIAARDDMAGCPKCAIDIVKANPHKEAVRYPNGFLSFRSLQEGEVLRIPEKWSNGDLDSRPRAYFAALPYSDGVTPGSLGLAPGVLSDYATFDAASARVAELGQMNDLAFSAAVDDTAALIDNAVREVDSNPSAAPYAQAVRIGTNAARQSKMRLVEMIAANNTGEITKTRLSIQNEFLTALDVARLSLQAFYGDESEVEPSKPKPPATIPSAVHTLVGIDPCAQSNVAAVCAAQSALGASPDGKYGTETASLARALIPGAPAPCSPRPSWWAPPGGKNCPGSGSVTIPDPTTPDPTPIAVPTTKKNLSAASVVGLTMLGAAAVGGAIYYTLNDPNIRVLRKRSTENAYHR